MDSKKNSNTEDTSPQHGETVEVVEAKDLVSVNDADCQHDMMHRDYTETDFIAFVCDNPNCGIVKLFDK